MVHSARHRLAAVLLAVGLAATGCAGTRPAAPKPTTPGAQTAPAPQDSAAPSSAPAGANALDAEVAKLTVEPEHARDGYQRELFEHWVDDDDGDGCDTRGEVLERESLNGSRCKADGSWVSLYDGYTATNPTELDIDHVVALAEAWDSGAWSWSGQQRREYANDLQGATLRAVTASENQRKSDKDPAQWQPAARGAWCQFAADWVSVKLRWHLTADPAEVSALQNMVRGCPATAPGTPAAQVLGTGGTSGGTGGAPAGAPTVSPASAGGEPFANCAEARAAGATPLHRGDRGYRPSMDGDSDGTACE